MGKKQVSNGNSDAIFFQRQYTIEIMFQKKMKTNHI